jgi:hypothetical protein
MSTQTKRVFPPFGMAPDVWGPIFWRTMHIVSLGYSPNPTEQEQTAAKQFYESLQYVIPCPICREHYSHILSSMPPRVGNRDELVAWVFDVHNKVNEQLGKPVFTWEQYVASMVALRTGGATVREPNWLLYGVAGAAIAGAGYYLYNKYK